MVVLINRVHTGRAECVYGLLRYLSHHFADVSFDMSMMKFDVARVPNLHSFVPCGIQNAGRFYCGFLENPLDEQGCALVGSVTKDSTRSKNVSDFFNLLVALGFITETTTSGARTRTARLSDHGLKFASTSFDSPEWTTQLREALLDYGPILGLLARIERTAAGVPISLNSIKMGFVVDPEHVALPDGTIVVPTFESKPDSITRTTSSLLALGVSAGLWVPEIPVDESVALPQLRYRDYLLSKSRNKRVLRATTSPAIPKKTLLRPLSYSGLCKNLGSLRESGQGVQREISMKLQSKAQNRRFAVAFALSKSAELSKPFDFDLFVSNLSAHEDEFVVNANEFAPVMRQELRNAEVIGAIWESRSDGLVVGLNEINMKELERGAPRELSGIITAVLSSAWGKTK